MLLHKELKDSLFKKESNEFFRLFSHIIIGAGTSLAFFKNILGTLNINFFRESLGFLEVPNIFNLKYTLGQSIGSIFDLSLMIIWAFFIGIIFWISVWISFLTLDGLIFLSSNLLKKRRKKPFKLFRPNLNSRPKKELFIFSILYFLLIILISLYSSYDEYPEQKIHSIVLNSDPSNATLAEIHIYPASKESTLLLQGYKGKDIEIYTFNFEIEDIFLDGISKKEDCMEPIETPHYGLSNVCPLNLNTSYNLTIKFKEMGDLAGYYDFSMINTNILRNWGIFFHLEDDYLCDSICLEKVKPDINNTLWITEDKEKDYVYVSLREQGAQETFDYFFKLNTIKKQIKFKKEISIAFIVSFIASLLFIAYDFTMYKKRYWILMLILIGIIFLTIYF